VKNRAFRNVVHIFEAGFIVFLMFIFCGEAVSMASAAGNEKIIVRYEDSTAKRLSTGISSFSPIQAVRADGIVFALSRAKRSVSGRFEVVPVTLDAGVDRKKILKQLEDLPGVKYAEFDAPIKICADPMVGDQYYLSQVNATGAWTALANKGNSSFVVVVMDTGIDKTHPDLAGNLWVNANEIPGNNIDDDGNGFIDDINGWDFWNDDNDPTDDHGHGTHVSGIIAALENGQGITGIAPNTKIMTFKIMNANGMGGIGDTTIALDLIREYKTRASNPVDIRAINMSFGGTIGSRSVREFIEELGGLGIAVFAAAGNDSQDNDIFPQFPANYDAANLVSVGSLDSANAHSWFTNYGQASVPVYAYGSDILSTTMGGNYGYMSGTSMATPVALGCFLLGWSVDPTMTVYEALTKFHAGLENTTNVPMGRAHAYKAVTTALPARFAYRMREHLALFSFPTTESGTTPVPGTVVGRGLGTGTFTIDDDALVKGAGDATPQFVVSRIFTRTANPYKSLRVNGGKAIKRMLINAPRHQIAQSGFAANRVLAHDGIFVRNGNMLYFVARDTARSDGLAGVRYFVEYDVENETWSEYVINNTYNWDIDNTYGMFMKGRYVYLMNSSVNSTVIWRFDTESKVLSPRTIANIENMSMSAFAWGGGKVWFAGGSSASDLKDAVGEFNPDTGEVTIRWRLPERLYYSSMAYRNGKLYIAGGQTAGWDYITSAYVFDTATGDYIASRLPFAFMKGQLVFGTNRLYCLLGNFAAAGGDSTVSRYGNQYMVGYADLTTSGWLGEWKIHPEFIYPKVSNPNGYALFTNVEGTSLEGTPNRIFYLFSDEPANGWVAGGYYAPAGTVQPDPSDDPDPEPEPEPDPTPQPTPTPTSGGGGCNAGFANAPLAVILLSIPLLFLSMKR